MNEAMFLVVFICGFQCHTPVGFEIVFPTLLEDAKIMKLDLPYDAEFLQKICDERALKMKMYKLV